MLQLALLLWTGLAAIDGLHSVQQQVSQDVHSAICHRSTRIAVSVKVGIFVCNCDCYYGGVLY